MASGIALLNQFAHVWAGWMGRILWQGSIVLLLLLFLTWLFPKMHPVLRTWLWRLAFIKLLFLLFWVSPLDIPVLQAKLSGQMPLNTTQTIQYLQTPLLTQTTQTMQYFQGPVRNVNDPAIQTMPSENSNTAKGIFVLFLLWVAGLIWSGISIFKLFYKRQRFLHGCEPVSDLLSTWQYNKLCRQLRLKIRPRLLEAPGIESPLLLGFWSPIVILPDSTLQKYNQAELRQILAHELVHYKRYDLLWNWLPTLMRIVLFFYPLIWLVNVQWRQVQEICCDFLTVKWTASSPADYGHTLVHISLKTQTRIQQGVVAFAQTDPIHILRKRLSALKQIAKISSRRLALAGVMIAVTGMIILVPWRLTARVVGTDKGQTLDKMFEMQLPKETLQMIYGGDIDYCLNFLQRHPDNLMATSRLTWYFYILGEYEKALSYNPGNPDDYDAILIRAWCYDALGQREEALATYREILAQKLAKPCKDSILEAAWLGLQSPHFRGKKVRYNPLIPDKPLQPVVIGWKATDSIHTGEILNAAVTNPNPYIRWTTEAKQAPGMYFQLDLGRVALVDRIVLDDDAGGSKIIDIFDYPRRYSVWLSADGEYWNKVASGEGSIEYYAGACFNPTKVRYIKVVLEGSTNSDWWSIYRVYVYTPVKKGFHL